MTSWTALLVMPLLITHRYHGSMPYKGSEKERAYKRKWAQEHKRKSRVGIYQEVVVKRRTAWLVDKSCAKCGRTDDLEIDHINPATKTSGSFWDWGTERRNQELAKCQVLCQPCHLQKTIEEKKRAKKPLVHGTRHGYQRHNCRCRACRDAENVYQREHRRKYQHQQSSRNAGTGPMG